MAKKVYTVVSWKKAVEVLTFHSYMEPTDLAREIGVTRCQAQRIRKDFFAEQKRTIEARIEQWQRENKMNSAIGLKQT